MLRRALEKAIAKKVIKESLALGYDISIDNGAHDQEWELHRSSDADAIFKAMFATDEEKLYFTPHHDPKDARPLGWVYFVYGNDGWDVISDYTTNLENVFMKKVMEFVDKIQEGKYEVVVEE